MPESNDVQRERTRRAIVRRRTRLEVGRLAVLLLLVLSVWVASFQGRSETVKSQRIGCGRSKLDRLANAAGWRAAETAREATGHDPAASARERATAAQAAARYAEIASGLERRGRINCAQAFPDPGPFALR